MKVADVHSTLVSALRGGRGWFTLRPGARPTEPLEVYEFEACPFCRKVRETLSELDLEYVARTSARGSAKREAVKARGGRETFPYLVDPNTGAAMYESEDIIDYLHQHYGQGRARPLRWLSPLNTLGSALASLSRPRGRQVRRPRPEQPPELLELYNFEASPYCRKVREALNELDLDYLVKNVAKKSHRRPELVARGGKMMVPYLIDPNTGTELYESDDIVAYLEATYG
jgi:glutathione S-transferase